MHNMQDMCTPGGTCIPSRFAIYCYTPLGVWNETTYKPTSWKYDNKFMLLTERCTQAIHTSFPFIAESQFGKIGYYGMNNFGPGILTQLILFLYTYS